MRPFPLLLAAYAAGFLLSPGAPAAELLTRPAGIFVIGDTRVVPNEVAKFDVPHISGYTLRVAWSDIESWDEVAGTPVYDFTRFDATVEDLRARGKALTVEIFVDKAPAYLMSLGTVTTWTNPHPTFGGVQPVPWDATALAAYRAMMQALADHVVPGTNWTFAEHPTLQSVDAPIVGLQGLRELSGTLVGHADYTRERFVQAVVDSVAASREAFAGKFGFLAVFLMEDDVASPRLDDEVYARLRQNFNLAGRPSLGLFQETLSDTGPNPATLGRILKEASAETYILFQALRPWTIPAGTTRPPEIASGTPEVAIRRAWEEYGATYVEIYGADVLNADNATMLGEWDAFLRAQATDVQPTPTPTSTVTPTPTPEVTPIPEPGIAPRTSGVRWRVRKGGVVRLRGISLPAPAIVSWRNGSRRGRTRSAETGAWMFELRAPRSRTIRLDVQHPGGARTAKTLRLPASAIRDR